MSKRNMNNGNNNMYQGNNNNLNNNALQKLKYGKSDKNLDNIGDQVDSISNQDFKQNNNNYNNKNKNWRGFQNNNPNNFNNMNNNGTNYNNYNNTNNNRFNIPINNKINEGEDQYFNEEKSFNNEDISQKGQGLNISSGENYENNFSNSKFKNQQINNCYVKIVIKLKDKMEIIEIQKEDDILMQAKEFCVKNNMNSELIKPIYNYINQSLNYLGVVFCCAPEAQGW